MVLRGRQRRGRSRAQLQDLRVSDIDLVPVIMSEKLFGYL